jgi:hypothetical protein
MMKIYKDKEEQFNNNKNSSYMSKQNKNINNILNQI